MSDSSEQHVSADPQDAALDPHAGVEATAAGQVDVEEPASPLTALQQELASARDEAATNRDQYLRARADMENFKRRTEQRYADQMKYARKDLLSKLLGVKDNIERALHYGDTPDTSGESVIEGVRLTRYQLEQLLEQEGVQPIETQGKPFDPHLEEAVQSVNDPSVPDHTVVQEVRKGYTYGDEVLRAAQVIVSVHEA
ncbi:MAG: nucleotide exchange factor GrpE [Chloroflexota bacterium]